MSIKKENNSITNENENKNKIDNENFFYGSIDVINNEDGILNYLYHLFDKQESTTTIISFDHDDYPINVKNISYETNISFSGFFSSNDNTPFSIYKNKNQIIKYSKIIDKMETMEYLRNMFYLNVNYNYDSSIRNCVYFKIDKDNMNTNTKNIIFCISKQKYGDKYLFGYNKNELNKSDVMTIIKYIFTNKKEKIISI
jgi:hypothetical protein